MIKKLFTAAVCFAAIAVGCSDDDTPPFQAPEAAFELVWSDEFEGQAGLPPDQTRWTYDIGNGPDFDGYGNGQLEFTTDFADNVALDGLGNLVITAQDTPFFFDTQFTAGRITTKNKLAIRFGRIEARMQLPRGKGLWPAFWMLGDSFPEVEWPGPGEIDIMEYRGQDPQAVFGSVHGPGFCGSPFVCAQENIGETYRLDGLEGFDEDFHVFAVEWDESRITWFVDEDAYFTVTPGAVAAISGQWVFDQPFFLLLNLAVGGGFVLEPPDATTPFPASMVVDYVRVFKRVRGSSEPVEVIDVDDGARDIPSPSAIEISPDSALLPVSGSQQLTVAGDGEPIINGVVWSSSNEVTVRVGTSGVVYGIAVGTASITAEISGVTDTIAVTVSATVAPPNAEPLPLIVDNSHPGRSAFAGPPDGAPFHTEDGNCPQRAGQQRGECHRFVWDGVNTRGGPGAFTGTFWTLGGSFENLGRLFVQSGAAEVSFYAWGAEGGEKVEFAAGLPGFGDIGSDTIGTITLTTEPTRYTIPLANLANYTEVVSPFTWSATNDAGTGNPTGFTFFIDDIVWQRTPPPPDGEPEVPAPTPAFDAADVISLFSDAYTDVPLTLADPDFDRGTVTVVELSPGENIRRVEYAGGGGNFAGITFEGPNSLDLTDFDNVRVDVWAPAASQIRINIVDFGADNEFDGGDDSNFEITFDASTTPALANGEWVTFDIPLSAFTGLNARANVSQIFLSVDEIAQTVFYDNILFYRTDSGSLNEPVTPAPTPTFDAANVISLFSDAYVDVPLTLPDPDFDRGTVSVVELSAGENIRRVDYVGGEGNFAGITFEGGNSLDLTSFSNVRFDVWAPVAAQIRVNLVDFGPDNAFDGGDDSNFEITFDASTTPALSNREWVTFDIPLSAFTGLNARANISRIFLSVDDPAQTVFYDNILFYRDPSTLNEPVTPAPTPTFDASNVVSLFSDAYTDVPVTLADPDFDRGTVTVVELSAGENIRRVDYAGGEGNFAGITFEGSNSLDLTAFENVRIDVWAPVAAQIRVNLVDFGPDNAFDGGDDSSFEITIDASTTPALSNREWVTIDLPLSSFTGLNARANISRIFLSVDDPAQTVFYDNILFYRPPNEPTAPPPAPTFDAANVISLFSDAYTDVPLTLPDPDFDRGTVSVVELSAGQNVRRVDYAGGGDNFAGITFEGANSLNLTDFDNVRVDVWAPVATQIRINLVDFGPDNAFDGGDDSNFEITIDASTTPALSNREWVTIDLPLSSFTGLNARANISQIFLSVDDPAQTVFYDNIIFYQAPSVPTFGGVVFDDNFGTGVSFVPFGGSVNNVTVDTNVAQAGSASLRVEVPGSDFTGGALAVSAPGVNTSGFNAVTFWARAESANTLDVAGIGNDAADTTFNTEITGLPLTTTWTQFTIPLPDPTILTAQTGLFHFAEGGGDPYVLWLDEIRYVNVNPATITNPRPTIAPATVALAVAETAAVGGVTITYNVGGTDVTLQPAAPAFLTYASSNESVATVDTFGVITAVAGGMANITASLDGVTATGSVMVNVGAGCSPTGPNLAVNGDFETGDFSCIEQFLGAGTQSITTTNPQAGTFAANLNVTVPDTDTTIKFANLTPGEFTEGETIHISFDMRGSVQPGGVVFAEFFSEIAGGGTSMTEILFGGPIFPAADPATWTNFRTTTVTGSDTTGGVSLQLKALSGAGNLSDIYFDNVCVSKSPCP